MGFCLPDTVWINKASSTSIISTTYFALSVVQQVQFGLKTTLLLKSTEKVVATRVNVAHKLSHLTLDSMDEHSDNPIHRKHKRQNISQWIAGRYTWAVKVAGAASMVKCFHRSKAHVNLCC